MMTMETRHVDLSVGNGKHRVNLSATYTMDGLTVTIVGGEKPHVGSIAVAVPRPSLEDPSKISATVSVFNLVGHKDDEIARPAAERLAKELRQPIVVVAGTHVQNAKDEDVQKLLRNSMQAVEEFARKIGRHQKKSDVF
mgnify:CR=1 FL=1